MVPSHVPQTSVFSFYIRCVHLIVDLGIRRCRCREHTRHLVTMRCSALLWQYYVIELIKANRLTREIKGLP